MIRTSLILLDDWVPDDFKSINPQAKNKMAPKNQMPSA